ncbi:DUF3375 family protein [Undibacterium sp. WLX3042]|uniref:DUF3375 family protein n=1 Tax=Undibacterium sp. WLX3042 TaxID=3412686 RepID=UPI003C309D36
MRAQPLWRLLASTTGPTVIGLLQSHLYEGERSLPASIFHERIARDLEELRAQGEDAVNEIAAAAGAGRAARPRRRLSPNGTGVCRQLARRWVPRATLPGWGFRRGI